MRRRTSAAGRGAIARAVAAIVVLAPMAVTAACQPPGPSPVATVQPSAAASTSAGSSPSSAPPSGAVTVDPSLLEILPAEVAGAPLQAAPEAATNIALDPSLATDVEAIAVGLAVAAGSSTSDDLVIVNVVRLKPDVFDDTFFRGWRDTYDAAACDSAGGVVGNAEGEIDGRKVFIGSCVNGAFTYHVRYGEDVIISMTSVGEGRFGEQVVNNLGT